MGYRADILKHYKEITSWYGERAEPKGLCRTEIDTVQSMFSSPLPKAYVADLSAMGKFYLGMGSHYGSENLSSNRKRLTSLLLEHSMEEHDPIEEIVVFGFNKHNGNRYATWFVLPSSDEDPVCYEYNEKKPNSKPYEQFRLTKFIREELEFVIP